MRIIKGRIIQFFYFFNDSILVLEKMTQEDVNFSELFIVDC